MELIFSYLFFSSVYLFCNIFNISFLYFSIQKNSFWVFIDFSVFATVKYNEFFELIVQKITLTNQLFAVLKIFFFFNAVVS